VHWQATVIIAAGPHRVMTDLSLVSRDQAADDRAELD
jgi:hypothetical protein